jgi:hypothetical protein
MAQGLEPRGPGLFQSVLIGLRQPTPREQGNRHRLPPGIHTCPDNTIGQKVRVRERLQLERRKQASLGQAILQLHG